jgi:hypothetical protein
MNNVLLTRCCLGIDLEKANTASKKTKAGKSITIRV